MARPLVGIGEHAAIPPASISSRIDGTNGHASRVPRSTNSSAASVGRVRVDLDRRRRRCADTRTATPGGTCERARRARHASPPTSSTAPRLRRSRSAPGGSSPRRPRRHRRRSASDDSDRPRARRPPARRARRRGVGAGRRRASLGGAGASGVVATIGRGRPDRCLQRSATMIAPGAGRSATMSGRRARRTRRRRPTARPSASPRSPRTARGSAPSRLGRHQVRRRVAACRASTSSPVMTASNVIGGSAATIGSTIRRHDIVTSAHGTPASLSSRSRRRAPGRHGMSLAQAGDDAVEQTLDDLLRLESDAAVLADVLRRRRAGRTRPPPGVVLGPLAAVRLDELVLGLHPVRLGVDERAVHVPQDGRRRPRLRSLQRGVVTPGRARSASRSCPWGG